RHENAFYSARIADVVAGKPRWRKVCDIADEVVYLAVNGDALYLLTTKDAPNGKVIRTSLSAPDIAKANVVLAESDNVIERIRAAKDGLYVQDINGGYGGLRRVAFDGKATAVALPYEGSITRLVTDTREDGAWLLGTGWLLPVTV